MRRALLVLGFGLVCAPAASAGTPGHWTPVTPNYNENFAVVGLHRTADGVLHVASRAKEAGNTEAAVHTPIAPNGTVGGTTPIVQGWEGLDAPSITTNPAGGLAVMWGGIHSTTTGDPYNNGGYATADDSGSAWTLQPDTPWGTGGTAGGTYVYAAQIDIKDAANVLFQAWSSSTGTWVHRGTDGNVPSNDFQSQFGGYGNPPTLALDGADGSLWLGWEAWQTANGGANDGIWAQQVDEGTGAPAGAPARMAGTAGLSVGYAILGHAPITGRPGRPGVWMAYPVPNAAGGGTKLFVWKVGDPTATTIADSKASIRQAAITADPDGRVIVVWGEDRGSTGKLFARASSTDVSSWSPAFEVPTLPKAQEQWAVEANAQSGALTDIVQNFTESDGTVRFSHTQALAPPVLAKAVDASVVSGKVLVKLPGTSTFVQLSHDSLIPVGSIVDATGGRVRITEALPGGKTASSDFYKGAFVVTQSRNGLATMVLVGTLTGAGARAAKVKVLRQLWADGHGKFRTRGRYASASIRGTTWLTVDRTDGTLVRVKKVSVVVRDFRKRKNVVVIAGHSYLAKARG